MANRYIHQDIEMDLYCLGIMDLPGFINSILRDEIDRIKSEKEEKEK